jgi:hypothetical protein
MNANAARKEINAIAFMKSSIGKNKRAWQQTKRARNVPGSGENSSTNCVIYRAFPSCPYKRCTKLFEIKTQMASYVSENTDPSRRILGEGVY